MFGEVCAFNRASLLPCTRKVLSQRPCTSAIVVLRDEEAVEGLLGDRPVTLGLCQWLVGRAIH